MNHILEHKMSLNEVSKIQFIECMFSEQNGIKLEALVLKKETQEFERSSK